MGKNILVAHGGGPTAVINTSLQGVIETARINGGFGKIYGAKFGAEGILKNDLLDLTNIPSSTVGKLSHTPATAIGSCRRKLSDKDYPAVIECMKKNDIGVFFYNGGNDSMDTCNKISILAEKEGLDLQVIGIPKTMDNDLALTDNCPGFGSAARYAAINASELALDANGLPIHVVVLELMGRNAGWVTAASALAARVTNCEVLTYLPEKLVDVSQMLSDIEKAYANGWAAAKPPVVRTGKKIAVIGSGPAGLAVADQLNTRGHNVTVFERSDRVGGLLRYGIPNMKLEKHIIDRKLDVMREEGVEFVVNANVGADVKAKDILKEYDAVVLACGASNPRDINATGRDANGIYFAVDFLTSTTKALLDNGLKEGTYISARDKNVVVIGGGDTGNDCVGTCIRHGCKSVTQLEMMPKAPDERAESNPWPQWPLVCKTDYGQEEAIAVFGHDPRIYTTTVKEFVKDKKGNLSKLITVSLESKVDEKTGRRMMVPVDGTEKEIPCELVLIAAGFLGTQKYVTDAFGVELNERTNIKTDADSYVTSVNGIFTAGDCHTGQSLVVKAIRQGRDCARAVDQYLMGYTNL